MEITYLVAIAAILATLVSPLIAVQVQKYLERGREDHSRRLNIFKTLMATRAARVSPDHVQALNMIDIEFFEDKPKVFKKVQEAWNTYRDHLNNFPKDEVKKEIWLGRTEDLLVELLFEMAISLDYSFDRVHLKRSFYIPEGLGEMDREITTLRKALVSLVTGEHAIKMDVVNFPNFEDSDAQRRIFNVVSLLLAGEDREKLLADLNGLDLLSGDSGTSAQNTNPASI